MTGLNQHVVEPALGLLGAGRGDLACGKEGNENCEDEEAGAKDSTAPVPVAPSLEKTSLDEPESVVPADLAMSPKSSAAKDDGNPPGDDTGPLHSDGESRRTEEQSEMGRACARSGTMLSPTSRLPARVTAPMASKALKPTIGRKARGCGEVRGWSSSTQPKGEAQISPWKPTPASAIRRRA